MRILCVYLLLLSLPISAQIELKIDAISSKDSIPTERKFTIQYHIANLTDKEVVFSLYPMSFEYNRRASMSKVMIYKIYQNQEFLDLENVFINKKMEIYNKAMEGAKTQEENNIALAKFFEQEMKISLDSINKLDEQTLLMERKKQFSTSIIRLQPNEKRDFTKTLIWNKSRYYKLEDNEFYLDENKPHYFELTINLMKEYFKDYVEVNEYQEILNNPSYIKGWFTSNKVEIDFKD